MKKFISLAAVVLAVVLCLPSCNSCGNKESKPRDEQVQEFRGTLSKEDTTSMLKLCDDAMEMLKNKKYDAVLANLYEYTDSTHEVKPLSDATARRYSKIFHMFPVLEYHRTYYSFQLEGCNDVKYKVKWATAEQAGTKDAPETAYMFNPVKIDGKWYLCVKTSADQVDESMQ